MFTERSSVGRMKEMFLVVGAIASNVTRKEKQGFSFLFLLAVAVVMYLPI